MSFPLVPYVRFHLLRVISTGKLPLGAFCLSIVLMLAALASMSAQWGHRDAAAAVMAEQGAKLQAARFGHPEGKKAALAGGPVDLPRFHSARLVAELNAAAADAGLTLAEVAYALEEGNSQPYLRYRITLSLKVSYPVVRQLAEHLDTSMPHLSFDAITCARENISVAVLNCDLVMSGFYRKDVRG